jgi:hypothetical protein
VTDEFNIKYNVATPGIGFQFCMAQSLTKTDESFCVHIVTG